MAEFLLTVNAGSSSIKFALFARSGAAQLAQGKLPRARWVCHADKLGMDVNGRLRLYNGYGRLLRDTVLAGADATHAGAMRALLAWREQHASTISIAAVGHRIVHGGTGFTRPVRLSAQVLAELAGLEALAPLHQPHNMAGVRAAMDAFPGVSQIACFDTAFHATQSDVNRRFALPRALHDQGVQRYGFHGLSYESILAQLHDLDPRLARGRVVVAHLGNGASMCAMQAGRSVATTMSFSPLDGLTMGTRCGRLDAAVVLYLLQAKGMTADQVNTLLFRESGLLGLSGVSSDMRELEASPLPAAADAITHFVEQVVQHLGSLAAALRGVDAIIFTGGIGENAVAVRERVMAESTWLGLRPDVPANRRGGPRLTVAGSPVVAWVLKTDEEAVIARHTARVLSEMAN